MFTIHIWKEDLGEGQMEWRGRLQHVVSREVYYFREWETLIAQLQLMLPPLSETPQQEDLL